MGQTRPLCAGVGASRPPSLPTTNATHLRRHEVFEAPRVLPAPAVRHPPVHAHLHEGRVDVSLRGEGLPHARALDRVEVQEGRAGQGHRAVQKGHERRGAIQGQRRPRHQQSRCQQVRRGLMSCAM